MHTHSVIPLQLPIAWMALLAALLWLANRRKVQPFRASRKRAQNGDHHRQILKRKVFMLRTLERAYFFAIRSIIIIVVVVNIYTQRKREVLTTITDQRQEIRSFPRSRRLREGEPVDNLWITFGTSRDRGKGIGVWWRFAVRDRRVQSFCGRARGGLCGGSASRKGQNHRHPVRISPAPSGKILGLPDLHEVETSRKGCLVMS